MMNSKEFRAAVRMARVVFVWAQVVDGSDGQYIEVSKAALLRSFQNGTRGAEISAKMRDGLELHIN